MGASGDAASEFDDDLGSLLFEDHQSPTRTVTESSEEGDGNDNFHEDSPGEDVPFDTGKLIVTHRHKYAVLLCNELHSITDRLGKFMEVHTAGITLLALPFQDLCSFLCPATQS